MARILGRERIVYRLDKTSPPALEIDSGDIVRVQTYDARTGTIRSEADLLDRPHPNGSNPATGPMFVRGAQPGDSLAVNIINIDLAEQGFVAVKARTGLLAHRANQFTTRIVPIRNGMVLFNEWVQFPIRPMVGVIGTAPAREGVATSLPGAHGGNMDNRYITTGSTVHLPVAVPGALLAIGDVHASMGDGEIAMLGLEVCAEVTIQVRIIKSVSVNRPWIETPNTWVTTGDSLNPTEALRIAAEEMLTLLQQRLRLSFADAYMLMSARADVQICQLCSPGDFPATARTVFPRLDIQPCGEVCD